MPASKKRSMHPPPVDLAQRDLVDVAPHPILAGLEGLHHGMPRLVVVRGGVAAGARVAAADMSAAEALAQAHPACLAGTRAVLADLLGGRGPVRPDLVEMRAGGGHGRRIGQVWRGGSGSPW